MARSEIAFAEPRYYGQELLTLGACTAFAAVCILLRADRNIFSIFDSKCRWGVFFGGVGLLVLVSIRLGYICFVACNSRSEIIRDWSALCNYWTHFKAPCADSERHHQEGESKTKGALAPWRYVLFLLPVALFFLGIPGEGWSTPKTDPTRIGWNEMEKARTNPDLCDYLTGATIRLKGKYRGDRPDRFTLVHYHVNGDSSSWALRTAVILIDSTKVETIKVDPKKYDHQYVEVAGKLRFAQMPDTKEFYPIIDVSPVSQEQLENECVKIVPAFTDWTDD
jgi:hypothetical protein